MNKYTKVIKQLNYILTKKQRTWSWVSFGLSIIGAFFQCLGVSVIIPLCNILLFPDQIKDSFLFDLFPFLCGVSYNTMVYIVLGAVIVLYFVKNLFFIFYSWFRNRYTCKIQRELSIMMMESYMSRGYEFFRSRNYGQLYRGIENDSNDVYLLIDTFFKFLTDIMTVLAICILLIIVDWKMTLCISLVAVLCVVFINLTFRKKMFELGKNRHMYYAQVSQSLNQSLQGIKDVMILRKQKFFVDVYKAGKMGFQDIMISTALANEIPNYIIETMCISAVILIVMYRFNSGIDINSFIANLTAMAVGAFRVLPYIGKITAEINLITQFSIGMDAVYDDIKESREFSKMHPEIDINNMELDNEIFDSDKEYYKNMLTIKDLTYAYRDEEGLKNPILKNINIDVRRGTAVAFIGASGAGKSTLVDVLLGLLIPQKGGIYLDGQNIVDIPDVWAKVVGYVPQSIYLCDVSIKENVAFGVALDEIDTDRVCEALKLAEMLDFVNTLSEGIETVVGDRGVRLSGGQRQRIAIARALYHRPEILVLDEATSALDNDTEASIMSAIDSLHGKITLVIVAHRLSTIKNCDIIYEVNHGEITKKEKEDVLSKIRL